MKVVRMTYLLEQQPLFPNKLEMQTIWLRSDLLLTLLIFCVAWEIWGNPITCHMRSEETPLRVTWDLRKPHYVSHEIWGNPITCHMRSEETPLRVTWDLRKPHYVSHEIWGNPITCHMLVSLSNIQSVAKLLCILQAIRLAKIGHNRIYHIIIYSWHRVSRMYPIMWLLQISHPVTCQ
jgi:hypothetical protein